MAYVDRELELAFMDMADLPAEFHDAYRQEWPPDPGYPQRAARPCSCTSCW